MLEQLKQRIQQLELNITQTVANHHFFSGALEEAKKVLALYNEAQKLVPVVEKIIPEINDVVDAAKEAVPIIEEIIESVENPQ